MRFDREVVHIVVNNITSHGVVHIVVAAYIVDHYCLRFDREVVHIVVNNITSHGVVHIVVAVILLTITV